MRMGISRHELSNGPWAKIKDFLPRHKEPGHKEPGHKEHGGRKTAADNRVL